MKLQKTKVVNYFFLLILFGLLNYTYFNVISNFYFVQRLGITTIFDAGKFSLGITLAILIVSLLSVIRVKPFIYAFLTIITGVLVFPAIILFQFSHNDWRTLASPFILFILIVIISHIKLRFSSPRFLEKNSFKLLVTFSIFGLIPFIIIYAPYIDFKNLLLIDIYETRAQVDYGVTNIYTNYMFQWFAKYIIPAIMVFALFYKNKLVFLGAIMALIFLFLAGANKAVYYGIVMVLLFYYGNYLTKARYFTILLILVTLLGLFAYYVYDYNEVLRYSIRRLVFIPPILDILYFDFFANSHLYWSESIMAPWIDSPYNQFHSNLIGVKYFRSEEMNANNGVFSDGFMNFGMLGVIINSTIVAIVLNYYSQLRTHPKFFGLFFLLFISIISSSLTTVFLTHGMLFLIFFGQFFLKDSEISLK